MNRQKNTLNKISTPKKQLSSNYSVVKKIPSKIFQCPLTHLQKIIETTPQVIPAAYLSYLPQQKFFLPYFIFDVHAKYAKYDAKANYKRNIKSGHFLCLTRMLKYGHTWSEHTHIKPPLSTSNYSAFSRFASLQHFGPFPLLLWLYLILANIPLYHIIY